MKILILTAAAVCTYLLCALNPAILLSKGIYKKDIRTCGSGNPGFTNFKRTFGNKWAWWVMVFDLGKSAVCVALFSYLYAACGGDYQNGAAFTGLFAMLGHAFPVWYGFRGGKGFLVYMSIIWFIDWRAGVLAAVILILMLLTLKYMSLSTMCAVTASVLLMIVLRSAGWFVIGIQAAEVIFIIVRHKDNIVRLLHGTESKFSIGKNKH